LYDHYINLTEEQLNSLLGTTSALASRRRLLILEMLQKRLRDEAKQSHSIEYYTFNVKEITNRVQELDDEKDDITEVAIRNNLNELTDAGLLGRIRRDTLK